MVINMPRVSYTSQILKATQGFLTASSELLLYWLFFSGELMSAGRSTGGVMRASEKASRMVDELDRDALQRTLYYLKQKGLVEYARDKTSQISITSDGREKLRQKFPTYFTQRSWDGKIYLVTYDIPEKRRRYRDLLREYLQRLGCALLQQSVWVAVYDPREILREWTTKHQFEEQVIVSDVGRDGSIAGKTIPELVSQLYDLDFVDEQYRLFIQRYQDKEELTQDEQWELNLDWVYCVELDPQLPFALLPAGFSGEETYELYNRLAEASLETLMVKDLPDIWEENERKHSREATRGRYEDVRDILALRYTHSDFLRDLEST